MLDRQLELSPDTLKTVKAFIAFINNPARTESVFDMADGLRQIAPDLNRQYDDDSYITIRTGQTHDIWHIITGFGTDLAGEMGLQAFTLAQTHSPLPIAIMTGSLVSILKSSSSLNPLIEKMQQGWQMGESAQPFLAQKWEQDWKKPLSEWRADLKVTSV